MSQGNQFDRLVASALEEVGLDPSQYLARANDAAATTAYKDSAYVQQHAAQIDFLRKAHQPNAAVSATVSRFFGPSTRVRDMAPPRPETYVEVRLLDGQFESLLDDENDGPTMSDLVHAYGDRLIVWLADKNSFITTLEPKTIGGIFYPTRRIVTMCLAYHGSQDSEFRNEEHEKFHICTLEPESYEESGYYETGGWQVPDENVALAVRFLARKPDPCVSFRRVCQDGMTMPVDLLEAFLDTEFEYIKFHKICFHEDCCEELGSFRGCLELDNCELGLHEDEEALFDQIGHNPYSTRMEQQWDDGDEVFFDAIANNRGPTGLKIPHAPYTFDFDEQFLNSSLRQTQTLTMLDLDWSLPQPSFDEFVQALETNQSLIQLRIGRCGGLSDERLVGLFQALKLHGSLQKLEIDGSSPKTTTESRVRFTRAIVDMLRGNKVLSDLVLSGKVSKRIDRPIFHREVKPRLVENRFKPRVKSILEEGDGAFRSRLVSKALSSDKVVSSHPTALWLFVSSFHEVVSQLHESAQQDVKPPARKKLKSNDGASAGSS